MAKLGQLKKLKKQYTSKQWNNEKEMINNQNLTNCNTTYQ